MRIDGCHINHDCDAVCSTADTKTMAGTSNQPGLCTESSIERNVAHLLYGFDRENRWKHFTGGQAPLSSSVERGTRKQRAKLKKIYLKRKRTIATRKNRAFADLTRMPLLCSCNQGCLMRPGAIEARQIIRQQRNKLFQKSYIEQNYILSKLMEVRSQWPQENKVPHPRLGTSLQGRLRKMLRTVRRQNQGSVKKNGRRWFIDRR